MKLGRKAVCMFFGGGGGGGGGGIQAYNLLQLFKSFTAPTLISLCGSYFLVCPVRVCIMYLPLHQFFLRAKSSMYSFFQERKFTIGRPGQYTNTRNYILSRKKMFRVLGTTSGNDTIKAWHNFKDAK